MSDKERMEERVEQYCDADRRARIRREDLAVYAPTIGEILDTIMADCGARA